METREKYRECEQVLWDSLRIHQKLPLGKRGICYLVEHVDWEMPLRLKIFDMSAWDRPYQLEHISKRWIGLSGHPHIVHAFLAMAGEKHFYLLTEYIPGMNLTEHLKKNVRHVKEVFHLAVQLAFALAYAHANRLVHGSLTPENILISGDTVFLGDFYGTPASENSGTNAFLNDVEMYGRILRYVFYSVSVSDPDGSVKEPTWELAPSFKEFIEKFLSSPPPFGDLRTIAHILIEESERYTNSALKYCPVFPPQWGVENLHKHAFTWMLQGKRDEAENLWNFAASQQISSMYAWWNFCLLQFRQGVMSFHELMKSLDALEERIPLPILCGQAQLAMEAGTHIHFYLEKVQRFHCAVESTPQLLRVEGEFFYRIGKFKDAILRFAELVKREERQPDDWYRLAASCYEAGQIEAALEVCRQGLSLHPEHGLLKLVEIRCRYMRDGAPTASPLFASLIAQNPHSLWGLLHAAEFYAGTGLYERKGEETNIALAKEYFDRSLKCASNNPRAIRGYRACGGEGPLAMSDLSSGGWSEIRRLGRHPNIVTVAAITRDISRAVSGDCEGNLYVWDVPSESVIAKLEGHRKHITDLRVTDDGCHVVSTSWDQTIRIWEIPSGKCVWEIEGHRDKVSCVDITPDSAMIISGGWDGTAIVWDSRSKKQVALTTMQGEWIADVAITADGVLSLLCNQKGLMGLWEIATQRIIREMEGITGLFSPDSRFIISSIAGCIHVWETASGKTVKEIATRGLEKCLGMSDDGLLLLTRNEDDVLSLWDLWSGRCLAVLTAEDISYASISRDGRHLICGQGVEVYLWENILERPFPLLVKAGYLPPNLREQQKSLGLIQNIWSEAERAEMRHDYAVALEKYSAIRRMPGYEMNDEASLSLGRCAVSGRAHATSLAKVHLSLEAISAEATALALAAQGETALMASHDDPISQWNLKSGYCVHCFKAHKRYVSSLAISQDARVALSGSWDGTVYLWNLDCPWQNILLGSHDSWITSAAISPLGERSLYGTRHGEVFLSDLTLKATFPLSHGITGSVVHVAMDASGKYALAAFQDGSICVWNTIDHTSLNNFRPQRRLATALAIAPYGDISCSATREGEILLWETISGATIARLSAGDVTRGLVIVGKDVLLSLSEEGILHVWNIPLRKCVSSYRLLGEKPMTCWSMTHDNRFLAITSEEKMVRLWELAWEWAI